eukprot:TRINITY_DN5265_c5_g1_i3.p1 TRINITY_DN5265_c5_g1~~TRINITY_DN5265_c5_g1_i3.p1  ORF type:complete len:222 (-),score=-13.03 TRINITY_DN5265_c5_g1_i3:1-597(-)
MSMVKLIIQQKPEKLKSWKTKQLQCILTMQKNEERFEFNYGAHTSCTQLSLQLQYQKREQIFHIPGQYKIHFQSKNITKLRYYKNCGIFYQYHKLKPQYQHYVHYQEYAANAQQDMPKLSPQYYYVIFTLTKDFILQYSLQFFLVLYLNQNSQKNYFKERQKSSFFVPNFLKNSFRSLRIVKETNFLSGRLRMGTNIY